MKESKTDGTAILADAVLGLSQLVIASVAVASGTLIKASDLFIAAALLLLSCVLIWKEKRIGALLASKMRQPIA